MMCVWTNGYLCLFAVVLSTIGMRGQIAVILICLTGCLAVYKNCTTGSDCESDSTCCGGSCTSCVSCEMFARHGSSCVCSLHECGSCLTGYEEVLTTRRRSSSVISCRRVTTPPPSQVPGLCRDNNDDTCPQGQYCYKRICQPCLDCRLYHRRTRIGFPCAKRPSDCGLCLQGYEEELVTRYPDTKPCRAARAAELMKPSTSSLDGKTVFVIGVLILGSLICAVFHARKRHTVPPPLTLTRTTPDAACSVESSDVSAEETVFTYLSEEKERTSFAVADPTSDDDDVENVDPSRLPEGEEDTLPSTWTPSATTATGMITSFSGVLSSLRELSNHPRTSSFGPRSQMSVADGDGDRSNSGSRIRSSNKNDNESTVAVSVGNDDDDDEDVNDIQVGTERVRIGEQ